MRKYQQLCLFVVSVISIILLLIYRSENNRLKYVLAVVNFFGRSDEATLIRMETAASTDLKYDFQSPLPIWQRIGKGFFAYSTYWEPNHLTPGGEVITLAIGLQHAIVGFKCDLNYPGGTRQTGKFGFTREEVTGIPPEPNENENYLIYRFVCRVSRDFGIPESMTLIHVNYNHGHNLPIRTINSRNVTHKLDAIVCLHSSLDPINFYRNPSDFLTENHLLQFFYHHHIIGIDEFLIYDSGFIVPSIEVNLLKNQIHFTVFPFNFPYAIGHPLKLRRIIEIDCLLRTRKLAKYAIIAEPHEFLYSLANLQSIDQSPLKSLKQSQPQSHRYDIHSESVCLKSTEPILIRNLIYKNDEQPNPYSIYRTDFTWSSSDEMKITKMNGKSLMFVHRYDAKCDNKTELHDGWRATVKMDFLRYIDLVDDKVQGMLMTKDVLTVQQQV